MRALFWIAAVASVMVALPTRAAGQDDERYETAGVDALLGSMDLLINNYTRTLTEKYGLTNEQAEFAQYIMRQKANQFLDGREEEVRMTLGRMFAVRGGGDMDPGELIDWGVQMRPLFEAAKDVIVQGNNEFREILTEDQRRIHDRDLEQMQESFAETEDQLTRIVSGEMTVDEFRNPRRSAQRRSAGRTKNPGANRPSLQPGATRPVARSGEESMNEAARLKKESQEQPLREKMRGERTPLRPTAEAKPAAPEPRRPTPRPAAGGAAAAAPSRATPERDDRAPQRVAAPKPGWEGDWEKYVREFIQKYDLNDEQKQRANSVLDDCKKQAHRYLDSRKSRIEAMEKQIAELQKSKDRSKNNDLQKLRAAIDDMRKPVTQIFERQLKPRLEKLPTRAQLKAASEAQKKPRKDKGES